MRIEEKGKRSERRQLEKVKLCRRNWNAREWRGENDFDFRFLLSLEWKTVPILPPIFPLLHQSHLFFVFDYFFLFLVAQLRGKYGYRFFYSAEWILIPPSPWKGLPLPESPNKHLTRETLSPRTKSSFTIPTRVAHYSILDKSAIFYSNFAIEVLCESLGLVDYFR